MGKGIIVVQIKDLKLEYEMSLNKINQAERGMLIAHLGILKRKLENQFEKNTNQTVIKK